MKIKLRISIFGMLMLLILIFGDNSIYSVIALSAAAAHEVGHIIAAKILGIKFKNLKSSVRKGLLEFISKQKKMKVLVRL